MFTQLDYILIAIILLLLIFVFKNRRHNCDHFENTKQKFALPLDQQRSANVDPLKGAITNAINTISSNTNTGLTTVLNQCLSTIQSNNKALQSVAAATCSAQLQSLSDSDLFIVQDALTKALNESQQSQTAAVNAALDAIQNAVNKTFSAPNFFVKYIDNTQNTYRAWTAYISLDGNSMVWNNPNNPSTHVVWSRAVPLTTSQDPTIISGGEKPISQLPSGYSNQDNIDNAKSEAITTFNWLNSGAKWPVLITSIPNQPNTYYIKQGWNFDPVLNQLIVT